MHDFDKIVLVTVFAIITQKKPKKHNEINNYFIKVSHIHYTSNN